MKTYCVKERMKTECVTGSERSLVTKNGRSLITPSIIDSEDFVTTRNGRVMVKVT